MNVGEIPEMTTGRIQVTLTRKRVARVALEAVLVVALLLPWVVILAWLFSRNILGSANLLVPPKVQPRPDRRSGTIKSDVVGEPLQTETLDRLPRQSYGVAGQRSGFEAHLR